MNKWIKYGLWIWGLLLVSCQNFLEPKSQSEYVPELVQSLDELLVGEAYMSPWSYGITPILGMFDDDVAVRPEIANYNDSDEATIEQVQLAFTWSEEMINGLNGYDMYSLVYRKIVGCNAVLDYLDGVRGTETQKHFLKAQALTLRSYYYFYLVNLYGKPYSASRDALGVPLKLISGLSAGRMPRNTVGEVYDQVVKDLLEAERLFKLLPREDWVRRDNRVCLPMIQLLLSRVFLYMENWSEALAYAEKVRLDYDYKILDLNTIPAPVQTNSVTYPDYMNWENPETIFLFGDVSDRVMFPYEYSKFILTDDQGTPVLYTIGVVSEDLLKAYEPTDLRKSRYLIWESTQYGTKPPVYRVPVSKLAVGSFYEINLRGGIYWGYAFKVTETYLNAAEAAAMLFRKTGEGKYLSKVWNLMDELRMNRFPEGAFNPCAIKEPEDLISFVRNERRREFCFENHRWFDIRRYGMEEMKHVWYDRTGLPVEYVLQKNDPRFTLLIPKEAFALNPGLVQNDL